jgi:hypothetical protein
MKSQAREDYPSVNKKGIPQEMIKPPKNEDPETLAKRVLDMFTDDKTSSESSSSSLLESASYLIQDNPTLEVFVPQLQKLISPKRSHQVAHSHPSPRPHLVQPKQSITTNSPKNPAILHQRITCTRLRISNHLPTRCYKLGQVLSTKGL